MRRTRAEHVQHILQHILQHIGTQRIARWPSGDGLHQFGDAGDQDIA
jgi:hypothetical protein